MELDDLKSAWNSIPEEKTYNKQDIFDMLKKKSSSTIKWLFLFTIFELALVLFFTMLSIAKRKLINGDIISPNENFISNNYIVGSAFTIIISVIFIAYTYKTYRKININNSITDLITQIIKFRKTINLFVLFILISIISVSLPYYYKLGQNIYINKLGIEHNTEKINTFGWIAVVVALVFIILITSMYYGFLYWFFLRKLSRNLIDLKNIK
ncbi:hypothetical protein [Faecalibacter rhinopitheci]|uniref:Uncharacterized protein n=1 Tax=Faecalibacter rhinopitheci TaxID=2779678 RepID=A0A8J7G3U3_9FLAO|nr:hypothetical protein [Faecalibacter rhinopitheci]MBF0596162.1 hypothetical protein [Faecalibacter rhinopitheci]